MLVEILLAVLLIALVGAFPKWPYSRTWGYSPSVGIGIILLIMILLWFGNVI
ncbi:DUF3309 family protein [Alloacidobacterium sp.]|uniref:DUF3309 family protein n=1 Tax=Alloacidobacterium sp. TaxID=2951999 RepID=UPI002D339D0B|nr:DUF3309 family protein [Alloacidobacterium sp.]HYK36300.1 DUF3309 family protein [Alloacidobacterium sp.]